MYFYFLGLQDITTCLDNVLKLSNYLTSFRTEINMESGTENDPEETDRLEEDDPSDDFQQNNTEP